MRRGVTTTSIACVVLLTIMLGVQLVAATAWTADAANEGPSIVILQLSNDPDTTWAVNDLVDRLHGFITDDPFFVDRVIVQKTNDPFVAEHLDGAIVIYATHGGPLGLVTGKRLTSWPVMARIVERSSAIMHLFMACDSKNIIRYGDASSQKKLYTVPGARPAEVTNVEITAAVLLALGHDSKEVEDYRTSELTHAKDLVQSGTSVHIMDFEQVILSEIDYIDDHYSDTYTDTHRVYRYAETDLLIGVSNFTLLPADLQSLIMEYYGTFWAEINGNLEPNVRQIQDLNMKYIRNYYYEATWIVDDPDEPPPSPDPDPTPTPTPEPHPEPGLDDSAPDAGDTTLYSTSYFAAASTTTGHWEYGPHIFVGGTYSGVIRLTGDGTFYSYVAVNVTARGSELNSVDSMALNQIGAGGVYVSKQKVDGVWQTSDVGRNPGRTGGLWTDPCVKADYENDVTWPAFPGLNPGSGSLHAGDDYLEVTDIHSTGTYWHGPSFVRTLPSFFRLEDMGSFSANLSLDSSSSLSQKGWISVTLYDSNKKPVVALVAKDNSASSNELDIRAQFYLENGASKYHRITVSKTFLGVVQVRYDPLRGVIANVPGVSDKVLYLYTQVNRDRLIKYVVIQSYRYTSSVETLERVYNIRISYAYSDYTVFHENCIYPDSCYQNDRFGMELVMEDAEDGLTDGWGVYTGSGSVANEVIDGDHAIHLIASSTSIGFRYPYSSADYWNDRDNHVIQWSMKYSAGYRIYVSVDTTAGHRYLTYDPIDTDNLGTGEYVYHGLGVSSKDGRWHTFQRDLAKDLHDAQPSVDIIAVNAFLIRGGGYVDDIKLLPYQYVKENAEDGRTTDWGVYDSSPAGTVSNVLLDGRRVIHLQGGGTGTGYRYPYSSSHYWNDAQHLLIRWSMKYAEDYYVYVSVDTTAGHRYIYYTPVDYDNLGTSGYVHHGLGVSSKDGAWHTFERDLLADLHDAQPSVDIIDVNAILFRGSGYVDDIQLLPRTEIGDLVSPSGQSYVQPTNIESRPGLVAWHGPTYVHVLDRPFRLYQLSEFSLVGQLVQADSQLGRLSVALYDDAMKKVVEVVWGDSWLSSQKGYFVTHFYAKNGESFSQGPVYVYDQGFTKTGKLWWDGFQGGNGAVYSRIDGQGDQYPIGECDDASRIIKYVVIQGDRFKSDALLQLRVHDINVVADLNRHDPTAPDPEEPQEFDGTVEGANNELLAEPTTQSAESYIQVWWDPDSWWPILHELTEFYIDAILYTIHYAVDLLESIQLVDLVGGKPRDDIIASGLIDLSMSMAISAALQLGLACLSASEYLWSSYLVPAIAWCMLAAGIALLAGATIWAFSYAGQNLDAGLWGDATAFFFFFGLFIMMFWILIGYKSLVGILTTAVMGAYLLAIGLPLSMVLDALHTMCKPLRFSRLAVLLLLVIFGLAAAHHYTRYYGR